MAKVEHKAADTAYATEKPSAAARQFKTLKKVTHATEKPSAAARQFKTLKKVTHALISLSTEGQMVIVKITEKIHPGKVLASDAKAAQAAGEQPKKPANVALVLDLLDNDEEKEMIFPAVLQSTLEESYPSDGYIGHSFQITSLGKKKGKDASRAGYNTFDIVEVEPSR